MSYFPSSACVLYDWNDILQQVPLAIKSDWDGKAEFLTSEGKSKKEKQITKQLEALKDN